MRADADGSGKGLEEGGRLFDGAPRLCQRLVLRRAARRPLGKRPIEQVEGGIVELVGDGPQPYGQLFERRQSGCPIASATRSIGCRASTPTTLRCIEQPGFADATMVAPVRWRARSIAAALRSRILPASSGCNAE